MTYPLFCYGTLRSPLVMKALTGEAPLGIKALLHHYAIFRVRGADYPGILPQADGVVEGTLYPKIDEKIFPILDDFEAETYFRTWATIRTNKGEALEAYVYCIREECSPVLSQDPWDYEIFLKRGLKRFMQKCFPNAVRP